MAVQIVNTPDEDQRAQGLHPLGLMHTSVHFNPKATPQQLADDLHCLFGAAMGALDNLTDAAVAPDSPHAVREPWWAMLYTMRAAFGAMERLYDALPRRA